MHQRRLAARASGGSLACTVQTLSEFAANPRWMGATEGKPAFSLVLHTWTQDLQRHIHVHAVMACEVLASACKRKKLPLAKAALHMPQSNAQAQESARAFMSRVAAMDALACPVCKAGRLRVLATALGLRQLPEAGASFMPCNRGPPP